MKENKIDIKNIENIVKKFNDCSANVFSVKTEKYEMQIKKKKNINIQTFVQQENEADVVQKKESDIYYIESDKVGKFFNVNPPDSPDRLKKGAVVKKGEKIANIVCMEIVYDIKAPFDLKIEEILCDDNDIIEYGQAIFGVVSMEGKNV